MIVGGGRVGARKAASLLNTGAIVHVISPVLHPMLQKLLDDNVVRAEITPYAPGALAGLSPSLVFAATDDPAVNRQVADEARSLGAWVDIADAGTEGNFLSMSSFQRGPMTIAVSSGGVSPALAIHLREKLERVSGDEYATLAEWMAERKPYIHEKISSQAGRSHLWKSIVESSILEDLRQGDAVHARALFERMIAEAIEDS